MEFEKKSLTGVKTPVIAPVNYELVELRDSTIKYRDTGTGETGEDELIFLSDGTAAFPGEFRYNFENDSVIVMLFSPSNKLFLHRRSESKDWAPGKIDLASVAGQRRAVQEDGELRNEDLEETALREVAEETGVAREKLKPEELEKIGEHYNTETCEHQTVFAYRINATLEKLNSNARESEEVEKWFEKDFGETLDEYFGDGVEMYAGGAELRPENFISDEEIRQALEDYHQRMELTEEVREKVNQEFRKCENQFHNFQHSRNVVEASKKICEKEGVSGEERENILVAGWLHDVGAVEGYEGHVERGIEKAGQILEQLGVEKERIEKIQQLIAATDPEKEPESLLEEIMQDSDAAFMARDDYFQKLENMWKEFREQGVFHGSREEFFKDSINYIDIEYHTEAAKELFNEKRKKNLEKLKQKVEG